MASPSQRRVRNVVSLGLLAGLAVLAGCDGGSVAGPSEPASIDGAATPSAAATAPVEVCGTVDFEQFVHGDVVTSLTVPELGVGFDVLTFAVAPGLDVARIFDTDVTDQPTDAHLMWSGPSAGCPACEGLGNVMVVEGGTGFDVEGDSDYGGTFFLAGFPAGSGLYLKGVTAVAADQFDGSHRLLVDGTALASSRLSAGAVQRLAPTSTPEIQDFVELVVMAGAHGGFDDLTFCRMEEPPVDPPPTAAPGGEGCTSSFWRHARSAPAWSATGLTAATSAGDALGALPAELGRPEQRTAPGDLDLESALGLRGAGVNQLLEHATAALLNALHPDVSYDLTPDEVRAMVADALSGGDVEGATETLRTYNDQVCPLK